MSELSPVELGRQLKKPIGETGIGVAENMNKANTSIYKFAFSLIQIKEDANILEIGAGNGNFIKNYFGLNPKITLTAIDYSETMCSSIINLNKELVKENRLIVKCEDSLSMSFANESFDIVLTINTLYFWEDIESQLEEIYRVLKPDGILLIGYGPKCNMKDLKFTEEVFKLYDAEELNFILKRQGFKIVREKSQPVTRISADGSIIESTDICVLVNKPG
jgi:ubiquinone/menaquinone biosynthesis C-methylase UbiE